MGKHEKRAYLNAIRGRYRKAGRADKATNKSTRTAFAIAV